MSKRHKSFTVLEPGWKGIFVTCARKKENSCRAEMVPLVQEYIEKLYPELENEDKSEQQDDIESSLKAELASLTKKSKESPVEGHLVGCECVVFIRLKKSVDPRKIVINICKDAKYNEGQRTRYAQKLTPVSKLESANMENIEEFKDIVQEGFDGEKGLKFAIRATVRNANLPKEELISSTARLVGPDQSVNLKKYDRLILLECFKNSLGLSVVNGKEYEELSRFNLQQIQQSRVEENEDVNSSKDTKDRPVKSSKGDDKEDTKKKDTAIDASA